MHFQASLQWTLLHLLTSLTSLGLLKVSMTLSAPHQLFSLWLLHNISLGADDITSFILKATASEILSPLLYIFNQSILMGSFPFSCKHSIIVPIHKSSLASTAPTHYSRSTLLKFFLIYFIQCSLISPKKIISLTSCSKTDALIAACQFICSSLDHATPACGVFLDIGKAFDSVSHCTNCTLSPFRITCIPGSAHAFLTNNKSQSVRVIYFSLPIYSAWSSTRIKPWTTIHVYTLYFLYQWTVQLLNSTQLDFSTNMFSYEDNI